MNRNSLGLEAKIIHGTVIAPSHLKIFHGDYDQLSQVIQDMLDNINVNKSRCAICFWRCR